MQDVVNAAVVADYCPEIDFIASHGFPHEVPQNMAFVAEFKAQLENSTKPIYFTAAGRPDLTVILEMAAAVAGGTDALRERPFLIHYADVVVAKTRQILATHRPVPLPEAVAALVEDLYRQAQSRLRDITFNV